MASALAKVSPTQQLVKQRAAMSLKRVADEAAKRRHTVAVATFAAGIGYYEKSGKTLPSLIPGVPPKVQLAVAAALIADNSTGETKEYARALCDGLAAIVGYQFGKGQEIGADGDDSDSVNV
jgi:hypothetical protein